MIRISALATLLMIGTSHAATTNDVLTPAAIAGNWNVVSATIDGNLAEKGWQQIWTFDTNRWTGTFVTHDPKGILGPGRQGTTQDPFAFAVSGSTLRLQFTRTRGTWDANPSCTNTLEFMTFTHKYDAIIQDKRLLLRQQEAIVRYESGRQNTSTNDGEIVLEKQ